MFVCVLWGRGVVSECLFVCVLWVNVHFQSTGIGPS